jgi:hypothetical protein
MNEFLHSGNTESHNAMGQAPCIAGDVDVQRSQATPSWNPISGVLLMFCTFSVMPKE